MPLIPRPVEGRASDAVHHGGRGASRQQGGHTGRVALLGGNVERSQASQVTRTYVCAVRDEDLNRLSLSMQRGGV